MLGHPLRVLATPLAILVVGALLWPASPAVAADSPGVVLSAPATARIGAPVTVRATVGGDASRSAGGINVQLQRQVSGGWTTIAGSVTTSEGVAGFSFVPQAGAQVLRARYGENDQGATSDPVTLTGVVVGSTMHIYGSTSVIDESTGYLTMRWVGSDGLPVSGRVVIYQHAKDQPWSKLGATTTGANGRADVKIRPRSDMSYQLRGASGPGWAADTSPTWTVDNRPPLSPITWRSTTPRPLALPAQRRAVGDGAHFVAQTIPDSVWSTMVGKSWHSGCPVGRSSLRYVTVNYWGFDGYRHRGELVVLAAKAGKFKVAMTKLYDAKVPIRAMYLPDRFGKNGNAPGANDVVSMKHDNTSAFNCRAVTGDPGTRSPHSYGGSIDLNPWENPFHSHVGWLPNSWWAHKQVGKYAWKSRSHLVVQLMAQAGFRWSYGTSDSQHFDG